MHAQTTLAAGKGTRVYCYLSHKLVVRRLESVLALPPTAKMAESAATQVLPRGYPSLDSIRSSRGSLPPPAPLLSRGAVFRDLASSRSIQRARVA